jgi:sugar lactone lactonase YvrE
MTDATSTADPTISTTNGSSSSGDPTNQPPAWDSEPGTQIVITEIFKTNFQPGQIFISSSVTDEIRVYDKESLNFLMAFTHPAFSEVNSPSLVYGPNGAAFNVRGNLVVAGYAKFVEFSDYGVEFKTYPKQSEESNENLVFDSKGNMYTTTATGGSDKLNQYAAADYAFVQTIEVPPGAGQLTGITFDGYGRLYVASQADNLIHFTDFNVNLETFTWFKTLPGQGNVKSLEGLQFNSTGELVAAAGDLVRYDVNNQTKLGVFDEPGDEFPVPLRVDNEGNIYTADYENGSGTAPADVIKILARRPVPDQKERRRPVRPLRPRHLRHRPRRRPAGRLAIRAHGHRPRRRPPDLRPDPGPPGHVPRQQYQHPALGRHQRRHRRLRHHPRGLRRPGRRHRAEVHPHRLGRLTPRHCRRQLAARPLASTRRTRYHPPRWPIRPSLRRSTS